MPPKEATIKYKIPASQGIKWIAFVFTRGKNMSIASNLESLIKTRIYSKIRDLFDLTLLLPKSFLKPQARINTRIIVLKLLHIRKMLWGLNTI